ncbi:MAG: thymidylate synthase [Christensenellaceae bacterium]|jgi:thymidylate synthase|nr:thymidylate synthase [Christensenellaceae bacterium]
MSYADKIFKNNIRDILENGTSDEAYEVRPKWSDGTPAHTIKRFCIVNRYDLAKEFPIITLRKTSLISALDELFWIWQKKSNKTSELKSHVWDEWAVPDSLQNGELTIGKAYGYQLGIKHKYKEGMFDQVDRVLFDLKNNPHSRRILTNIYNHSDLSEMNLYPCAYSMTFNVTGNKLNGVLNQRSQDMIVANNWNVVQYSALIHAFAQVSGLDVGEFVHVIADAHIYDRHIPFAKELLTREEFPVPTLTINKEITNFYDFKVSDFALSDYQCSPNIKLEVAV